MAELDRILKTIQPLPCFEEGEILHFLKSLILHPSTPIERPMSELLPDYKLQKNGDHVSLVCRDGCMEGFPRLQSTLMSELKLESKPSHFQPYCSQYFIVKPHSVQEQCCADW